MPKIILPFILVTMIIVIACNSNHFNLAEARKSILEQNTKRVTALKDGNIDTLLELYMDDATLLPPNDTMKKGKNVINMYYLITPRDGKVIDASIVSTDIKGVDATVYEIGEYNFIIQPFESDATQIDNGKYIAIWKQQLDGSWKIFAECWNSNPPVTNKLANSMKD